MKAQRFFWPLYILLLLAAALAGSEGIASFIVPSWPARDLRPIEVRSAGGVTYNDWGLRDRPRSFERPSGVRFRSVLVGDSFLEGNFIRGPLSAFVEERFAAAGQTDMEAINFGVSATGPRHYYYRIKNVALTLKPDVIVLAVYAGNDFVATPFGGWMRPPIAELPLPSLLAGPAPRTTWLAVNRLGLSELGRNNKQIDGEFARLNEWVKLPADERLERVVRHLKQNYYPRTSEETMREILSRGDGRFWTAFDKPAPNRELLAGWLLSGMIDWETGTWKMPRDAEDADRMYGTNMVDETLSWLVAADRLAKENGVQLVVALIPVGTGDPNYVDFWRFWPKYFSTSLIADARLRRLAVKLRQTSVPFFDLRDDLGGVADTYRLTDGHWTERGMEIVSGRVARELIKMRRN
ncbi:MAG: hypothetical protein K2X72_22890 [Reyranella sp.]|nr:hypothetical protein [Reyranella sp.]